MSLKLNTLCSAVILLAAAVLGTGESGAVAQVRTSQEMKAELTALEPGIRLVQSTPNKIADDAVVSVEQFEASQTTTLADLVAAQPVDLPISAELNCLAGAIYFEAKSESMAGQLAVGRVIVNRSHSGRFPASYCGVIYQHSQFSFVRGHSMPHINKNSQDWQEAVAIARIAEAGGWKTPAEGALFFHADHVAPKWRLTKVTRVEHHIFYR